MTYENLSTPKVIAKWFHTSSNNIRQTYKVKKPYIYQAQCISAFVLENNITAKELQLLIEIRKLLNES